MNTLEQFHRQSYLNLETFRKSGAGVKTPVWFVQDGERLYVQTGADSGKVKRIRRDGRVNAAACRMDGRVTGAWVPARAHEATDPEISAKVNRLLDKKYGLLKKLFEKQRARGGAEDTILEITFSE
jgi:PPOX class probable F420-dependent enzyme